MTFSEPALQQVSLAKSEATYTVVSALATGWLMSKGSGK
jgi:hypothetical protein